jgi:hypothetical protein
VRKREQERKKTRERERKKTREKERKKERKRKKEQTNKQTRERDICFKNFSMSRNFEIKLSRSNISSRNSRC